MKLKELKLNKANPRFIKDDKFRKLLASIKDFPKMMELRPIVYDTDGTILGGNMRYRALTELGYKDIPDTWAKRADQLTDDEKRRFIIEDNVGFGDWDMEALASDWDLEELEAWGVDLVTWHSANNLTDKDIEDLLNEEFDPIGESSELQRVVFIFKNQDNAEMYLKNNKIEFKKMNMAWQVDMTSQSI